MGQNLRGERGSRDRYGRPRRSQPNTTNFTGSGCLDCGTGKTDGTTQDGTLVLRIQNGQRDTRLNGNGVALIDLGGPTNALFGLALSLDKTEAVAVGWKSVDVAAVRPTNNGDAKTVHFSLPRHNKKRAQWSLVHRHQPAVGRRGSLHAREATSLEVKVLTRTPFRL